MNKNVNYYGFVLILGRSNVGKSTLMNKLLKQKISITSSKPQTTRNIIMGVKTEGVYQVVYMDTPGIYHKENNLSNSKFENYITISNINKVKLIIFMIERTNLTNNDEKIINKLHNINCPIILLINKIDHIIDKKKYYHL